MTFIVFFPRNKIFLKNKIFLFHISSPTFCLLQFDQIILFAVKKIIYCPFLSRLLDLFYNCNQQILEILVYL